MARKIQNLLLEKVLVSMLQPVVLSRVASFLTISETYALASTCRAYWRILIEDGVTAARDIYHYRNLYFWPAAISREDKRFLSIRTGHMRLFEHEWELSKQVTQTVLRVSAVGAAELQFNMFSGSVASTGSKQLIRRFLHLWCKDWFDAETFETQRLCGLFTNLLFAMFKSKVPGKVIVDIFDDRTIWPPEGAVRTILENVFYREPRVGSWMWEHSIRYMSDDVERVFVGRLLERRPQVWKEQKLVFAWMTNSVLTLIHHWNSLADDEVLRERIGLKLFNMALVGNGPAEFMRAAPNMAPALENLLFPPE
jgi:hypothetical protein